MAKINILEPAVFNKIAAGEVVERPSSVVKELVENSIDAGATRLSVEIKSGGISKIMVSDNGVGIEKDDLSLAYLPHTTSKIKVAEDLNSITTLGFRGEALASICSVSKVSIISKTKDSELANFINIHGGEVVDSGETGASDGTTIVVEDLFFNVPVRAKFLKKPKQEENEITSLMIRLILANPNIAIKYIADDQIVFNSQGEGLEDAIFAVYGKNTATNVIPVDFCEDGYSMTGFASKTNFFKPNRTYQTLIVNGRYVTDYLVSQAVSRAFEPYMLKQCFPLYVLNLNVPLEEVDVNVHPSKMEVRFANSQHLFGFVYKAVKNAIDAFLANSEESQPKRTDINDLFMPNLQNQVFYQPQQNTNSTQEIEISKETKQNNETPQTLVQNMQDTLKDTKTDTQEKLNDAPYTAGEILIEKLQSTSFFNNNKPQIIEKDVQKFEPKPIQQQILSDEILSNDVALSLKIVGKVFNTFVIVEVDDIMYMIDQHAAHERILYDKLVQDVINREVKKQGLLLPYTFDVNTSEYEFINKNLAVLNDLGFEVEPFGNRSFKVSTIPADLVDLQIGNFFNSILSDLNTFLILKTEDVLKDTLAQHACKHAVKGGDDLNREELVALIKKISDGKMTMQCPHGRPFVVEIKRAQIDKWFKRTL